MRPSRRDLARGSVCAIKLCFRIAHPLPVLDIVGPPLLAPANSTNQRSFAVISVDRSKKWALPEI